MIKTIREPFKKGIFGGEQTVYMVDDSSFIPENVPYDVLIERGTPKMWYRSSRYPESIAFDNDTIPLSTLPWFSRKAVFVVKSKKELSESALDKIVTGTHGKLVDSSSIQDFGTIKE